MKRTAPALVLFLLAPATGELLSGSAPPVEFFQPIGLAVLAVLYGGGAVLVRELLHRWGKGWLSLLVLGAAYGIIEEGLMVKSFFDPEWMDLGVLSAYGRSVGVNWVWSLGLTIYHAVVSIAIPITLTELIFPGRRHDSWVGSKSLMILGVLFTADIALGYFALTEYRPGPAQYWVAAALVAALIVTARALPAQPFAPRSDAVPRSFRLWLLGFLGTVAFFLAFWGLPLTGIPALVTILVLAGGVPAVLWVVLRLSGGGVVQGRHRLALVAGCLTVFILMAPIREFDAAATDNPAGMTVVGLAAAAFLLWLWWRLRRQTGASGP